MKTNQYWAIKYRRGYFNPRCFYTRKDAIAWYLTLWPNNKTWAWHKKHRGVSVVKVQITEIEK